MADVTKFLLVGLKENLPAVRDADKLYWCSDTRELYKGMDLYTEGVRVVASRPTYPAIGVLYILPDGKVEVYTGSKWITVALSFDTSDKGVLTANSTDEAVPTSATVYNSIVTAIDNAIGGGEVINNITSTTAGTITVTQGQSTSDVAIKGVVVNPSYDASTRTISLPSSDGTSLDITLGKDIFIDPDADNRYNPETGNIELWLNDGASGTPTLIEIPAESLINIYIGGETRTAKVHVSDNNEITVDIKISAEANNIIEVKEDGLFVDTTGYATKAELTAVETDINNKLSTANTAIESLQTSIDTIENSVSAVVIESAQNKSNIESMTNEATGILAQAKAYTDVRTSWETF